MKGVLYIITGVVLVGVVGSVLYMNRPIPVVPEDVRSGEASVTKTEVLAEQTMEQVPLISINPSGTYTAKLTTTKGDIVIELNATKTPITVNNFVSLARSGFYVGTVFHRVIEGFMIQGGDPNGDGTGGPGYVFDDEPFEGEYIRGTVAMANAGPNTNGSQFFIIHKDTSLPKNHVLFGRVVEGLDVVDMIAESEVEMSAGGEMSKPVTPIKLTSVEILEE